MTIVPGRKVTDARTKPSASALGARTSEVVIVRPGPGQQRTHAGPDQVGHRPALSGGKLLEATGLLLGELNLGTDHDYITLDNMLSQSRKSDDSEASTGQVIWAPWADV